MSTNQDPKVTYAAQVSQTILFSPPVYMQVGWFVMQDKAQKPPSTQYIMNIPYFII